MPMEPEPPRRRLHPPPWHGSRRRRIGRPSARLRTVARPNTGEGDPGKSRACPACGALVVFLEWPGDEVCLGCGQLLYVNSTGQVSHSPIDDLPDP
jgi:hypothetical protein